MDQDADRPRVLVTGASGFVGGRIAELLCLSGAAEVRAGIRRWSSPGIPRLARFPIELVFCDVMAPDQVDQAVAGAAIVIHSVLGDPIANVEGTRNVLEAALKHGVQRVVHLSSAEVFGQANGRITEETPCARTGWDYADSKIEAEQLCWDYAARGVPVAIMRPSIVYGPFSDTWIVRFAARLQSGRWKVFAGYGDGNCNLIYVDDLVAGVWLAAHHDQAVGQAFNLNGPEVITWNDYFRRYNAALGLPELDTIGPTAARIEATALDVARSALVFAKDHLAPAIKKKVIGEDRKTAIGGAVNRARFAVRMSPPLRELLHLYNRRAVYVADKARTLLGFEPKVDVSAGLQMSVRWLAHHGYITQPASVETRG